jgi:hypothetical protein
MLLGGLRRRRFAIGFLFQSGRFFELVFLLERSDHGFGLLGARLGGLRRMNLFAAIDRKRLRRY